MASTFGREIGLSLGAGVWWGGGLGGRSQGRQGGCFAPKQARGPFLRAEVSGFGLRSVVCVRAWMVTISGREIGLSLGAGVWQGGGLGWRSQGRQGGCFAPKQARRPFLRDKVSGFGDRGVVCVRAWMASTFGREIGLSLGAGVMRGGGLGRRADYAQFALSCVT